MNSQQLLFINFVIIVVIVLFFVLGRSKPKPSLHLNLRKPEGDKNEASGPAQDVELKQVREVGKSPPPSLSAPKTPLVAQSSHEKKKALQSSDVVFFVYNGHEWEAHEVLGVATSCNLQEVTAHYQHLVKTADLSTLEFYESAHLALLKAKSKK